jgi:hypothetical protein
MLTSVNKKIFDLVLSVLNSKGEDKGVIFSGNFLFKFFQQSPRNTQEFSILEKRDNTLELGTKEVVPVVNVENIEIPFNELNKRSDWEATYWVAIKVPDGEDMGGNRIIEFDNEDPRYQALMEGYQELKNTLSFDGDGFRASFKVREPQKVNTFIHEGSYYQIMAFSFNVVKIEQGRFGNEDVVYFGEYDDPNFDTIEEYKFDTYEVITTMAKNEYDNTETRSVDKTTKILNRNWECRVTINYLGKAIDNLIDDETWALTAENDKKYKMVIVRPGLQDIEKTVVVTHATSNLKNNAVLQYTFVVKNPKE